VPDELFGGTAFLNAANVKMTWKPQHENKADCKKPCIRLLIAQPKSNLLDHTIKYAAPLVGGTAAQSTATFAPFTAGFERYSLPKLPAVCLVTITWSDNTQKARCQWWRTLYKK
jgi:hypothetical protein